MRAEREQAGESADEGVSIARRWAEYLLAVLAGNIVYLFVEPQLPATMQHHMFRVDLGLGVDFVICATMYGLVRLARGRTSGGA